VTSTVILYCDSSALVKLVIDEPESGELEAWLGAQPEPVLVSSVLARTEVVRAVARTDPDAAHLAVDLLAAVSVVELDVSLADDAARLDPAELRSLDALHMAAALRLGPRSAPWSATTSGCWTRRDGTVSPSRTLAGHPRSETHRRERGSLR
jgi:uncharacterized protein